jgi:ATP-dependent protease Clp ATPase subunit
VLFVHIKEILRCSFCKTTLDQVAVLITSPLQRTYICDECVRVCLNAIDDARGPSGRLSVNKRRCSFCRKGSHTVKLQSSSGDPPNASICEECLAVCMSILEDVPAILEGPNAEAD